MMHRNLKSTLNALLIAFVCINLNNSLKAEEPLKETILAEGDSFPIHISYYPAIEEASPAGVMNAPVVVMLHDMDESRLKWDKSSGPRTGLPFPAELQKRGYAVITVDFRKHGESVIEGMEEPVKPTDYNKMVLGDLAAVKKFLYEEHMKKKLNMAKLGIVAVGMAAPLASAFAEVDWKLAPYDDAPLAAQRTPRGQDTKVLVFLSPVASAGKMHANRSMNYLRTLPIALLQIAGEEDISRKKDADKIHQVAIANPINKDRVMLITPKVKLQGLTLMSFDDPRLAYIPALKFLDDHLKALEIPWQDRRSRLQR